MDISKTTKEEKLNQIDQIDEFDTITIKKCIKDLLTNDYDLLVLIKANVEAMNEIKSTLVELVPNLQNQSDMNKNFIKFMESTTNTLKKFGSELGLLE
jgi:hypothetical protein